MHADQSGFKRCLLPSKQPPLPWAEGKGGKHIQLRRSETRTHPRAQLKQTGVQRSVDARMSVQLVAKYNAALLNYHTHTTLHVCEHVCTNEWCITRFMWIDCFFNPSPWIDCFPFWPKISPKINKYKDPCMCACPGISSPPGTWPRCFRWVWSHCAGAACSWCWFPPSPRPHRNGRTGTRLWTRSSPRLRRENAQRVSRKQLTEISKLNYISEKKGCPKMHLAWALTVHWCMCVKNLKCIGAQSDRLMLLKNGLCTKREARDTRVFAHETATSMCGHLRADRQKNG